MLLQPRGERGRGGAPALPVGVVQERERLLLGQLLRRAVERHPEAGGGEDLVEQTTPGALAGVRELFEDALLRLGQDVRPIAAHRLEQMAAAGERRIGEQRGGVRVVCGHPLELEEDHRVLHRAAPLLHALEQRAVRGRGGVGGEAEPGVGAGAARRLEQRLELASAAANSDAPSAATRPR